MVAYNHPSRVVRVAVVGDHDTGKTSLISTAANDTFDQRPVPVLPPTKLAPEYTPEGVALLLTDTSAAPEASRATDGAIQSADAVLVCFDGRKPTTLEDVRQVSETHRDARNSRPQRQALWGIQGSVSCLPAWHAHALCCEVAEYALCLR